MNSLKICVVIAAELITEVGSVLEDKKVKFSEIVGLAPELIKIPKFVANIQPAISELKEGVSGAYMEEIKLAVAEKLYLQNDKAEIVVESCVNWIVFTSSTVLNLVKALKEI